MCGNPTEFKSSPAKTLAELMKREMGIEVGEHLLRLFIINKWSRITTLAHAIHDREVA